MASPFVLPALTNACYPAWLAQRASEGFEPPPSLAPSG